MLADRAGIALESSTATAVRARGPSKTELFEVNAWAEEIFAEALRESAEVMDYVESRGLTRAECAAVSARDMPRRRAAGCWLRRGASDTAWSCWSRPGWSASRRCAGTLARAVPGPADLPDP